MPAWTVFLNTYNKYEIIKHDKAHNTFFNLSTVAFVNHAAPLLDSGSSLIE